MREDTAARRPPTPKGRPVVGQTVRFARDAFGCLEALVGEHGDVVGVDVLGIDDLYVFAHPEYVERALVTERDAFSKGREFEAAFGTAITAVEGEAWREQRDLMGRFFSLRSISEYAGRMAAQTDRRIDRWRPGETRQAITEMKNLTLDIIFATIFGRELDLEGTDALRHAADGLNGRFSPGTWVLPHWIPTRGRWRFERAVEELRETVRTLAADADPDVEGDDLVSVLAGAGDSAGYPRTRTEIEDQLIGMIFAGHETTALALAFTWYHLSEYPEVRERFHAELEAVLGGDPPTMADLPKLEYTERVLKETLRLYPPVHGIPRDTVRDVDVGGYTVPEGSTVLLSTYLIHRDERFFEHPEEFRPDRWADDLEADLPDFAYFPFGGGPRRCLGQQFATVEAKTVLGTVGQRFHLDYAGDGLKLDPQMTMHPEGTIPMVVRER